jgi:hypothetical protein
VLLLEKEVELLGGWFSIRYPMAKLKIDVGTSDKNEEYHFELIHQGKHYYSEFIVPLEARNLDEDWVRPFKGKFLEIQKRKLQKAMGENVG